MIRLLPTHGAIWKLAGIGSGNGYQTQVCDETHGYWKRMAVRFAECTPGASLLSITGSNHYAPVEKIDQMVKAILSFVDTHQ